MSQLQKDLQAVLKSLKQVTRKTESIAKRLESLEQTRDVRKPTAKAPLRGKTVKKATASETVLTVIKRYKKGVDNATLRSKTGFDSRKIRDILYRLKKQGKIKSEGKGVYLKA
jgi:hypothetical protein